MNYLTWMRQTVGEKWVVAARTTPRIQRQYPGAVIITPRRMKDLDRQYRILYGDPYDKQRAAMYTALCDVIEFNAGNLSEELRERAHRIIAAEADAR